MGAMVVLKRGDTRTAIKATLKNPTGIAVDLTNASVKFIMADPYGTVKINRTAEIQDAPTGIVWFVFEPPETSVAGTYQAEFEVTFGDGRIDTYPNDDYLNVGIISDLG